MIAPLPIAYSAGTSDLKSVVKNMHVGTKAVFVLTVISIAQLVPVSGQLNCTQWRKLNAYDNSNLKSCVGLYSWDLKFEQVWILNARKRLGCKWSGF